MVGSQARHHDAGRWGGKIRNEILTAILDHHKVHLPQIAQFTRTGYSFEEWLNWQAYWACSQKGWKSAPKPEYKAVGFKTSKSQADLLVEIPGQAKAIIELGLVHDWTQSHWRDKLEEDRKKLEPPFASDFNVQGERSRPEMTINGSNSRILRADKEAGKREGSAKKHGSQR